ncbi:hypothetical protein CVT25_012153 [Psilocybe cyanescens]|uniref:Uncharacterized protein n=1 Tax=Psilocybe cyanescens TaxID=93625 RepID=A0A409XH57_PSICY|nr:hypothetical protein CVT25_012153 [Psilocybe cyanescens]
MRSSITLLSKPPAPSSSSASSTSIQPSAETTTHLLASLIIVNNDNAARQLHHAHPLYLAYRRHTLRDGPLRFRVLVVVCARVVCMGAGGAVECGRCCAAVACAFACTWAWAPAALIVPKNNALGDRSAGAGVDETA